MNRGAKRPKRDAPEDQTPFGQATAIPVAHGTHRIREFRRLRRQHPALEHDEVWELVYDAEIALATHTLEDDPPTLSSMRRETCTICGAAVLTRPDGTKYGSATEQQCATI